MVLSVERNRVDLKAGSSGKGVTRTKTSWRVHGEADKVACNSGAVGQHLQRRIEGEGRDGRWALGKQGGRSLAPVG